MNTKHSLAYLFEISFNIGILTYIKQKKIKNNYGDIYKRDIANLNFRKIRERLFSIENITNTKQQINVEKWCLFVLNKGFLSGYNFIREYFLSVKVKENKLEILYLQCNFSGNNSFNINSKDRNEVFAEIIKQLTQDTGAINYYSSAGEFLNADSLILLKVRNEIRLLSIDLSFFSFNSLTSLGDIEDVEEIKNILQREINYIKSKSVFSNLSIDTGRQELPLSEELSSYLIAFSKEDKESYKLIQAGSYAYSFQQFLSKNQIIPNFYNVIGYSDRGASGISIYPHNLDFLQKCHYIYKNRKKEDIKIAREKIIKIIIRNAKKSFDNASFFFNDLQNISLENSEPIIYHEKISDFGTPNAIVPEETLKKINLVGEMSLRNAHKALVYLALTGKEHFVFLTGNPGIGKTTALVKFLEKNFAEGFLFLYFSPRKQVNLDIINKFILEDLSESKRKQVFAINTDSQIIKSKNRGPTVQYFSELRQDDFTDGTVHFLKANPQKNYHQRPKERLKKEKGDLITDLGDKSTGVVNSLFQAVNILIDKDISRNVVATLSLQALKKTNQGKNDTLDHFEHLFKSAYNKVKGTVLPDKMQKISSKFKHFFIMIDEITGDPSGVEFLHKITQFLDKYELFNNRHGFNTKVIVADASIVETSVIQQHISNSDIEPNKIFYRKSSIEDEAISQELFTFNRNSAVAINTNSYPASELIINYKIFIECFKYDADKIKADKPKLEKKVDLHILNSIVSFIQKEENQLIVYIQNKKRLYELIEKLKAKLIKFEKFSEYIEIHSNSSEFELSKIKDHKNEVKVIFMTASASRGLSFPKVQHILVDLPRFSVEQNLMEIIQVIYRGRGRDPSDGLDLEEKVKELTFYISEAIFYESENSQLSIQEGVLNVIDIILILKSSILTRIKGSAPIGKNNYKIIPVEAKSVSLAETTFTETIVQLRDELQKQISLNPTHQKSLRGVSEELVKLLDQVDIKIRDLEKSSIHNNKLSYLSIRESFFDKFRNSIAKGFNELLDFPEIEHCHIQGSLLIVPIQDKTIKEVYQLHLNKILSEQLLDQINSISNNPGYSKSLKFAAKSVMELIDKLKESDGRTQYLQQDSMTFNRYYCIPLFAFTSKQAIENYFAQVNLEDSKNNPFRDILKNYLSSLFPIQYILPVGYKYEKFPFLLFTSYALEERTNRLFTKERLLTSFELNILNLLLAQEIKESH